MFASRSLDDCKPLQLVNNFEGLNTTIGVPDNEYILDTAQLRGINLPSSCCVGACSSCTGQLKEGTIDQAAQSFLDDEQITSGYVLLCVSHATSDCTIVTHKEQELWDGLLKKRLTI